MSALAALRTWWQARDLRERRMLGLMCVLVAAFVAWYGIHIPLRHLGEHARGARDQAAARLAQVQTMASAIDQAGTAPGATPEQILAAASAAGIAVSQQRIEPGVGLVLDIEAVAPAVLFAWLDALRNQHGTAPVALNIAAEGERLRVRVVFGDGA